MNETDNLWPQHSTEIKGGSARRALALTKIFTTLRSLVLVILAFSSRTERGWGMKDLFSTQTMLQMLGERTARADKTLLSVYIGR